MVKKAMHALQCNAIPLSGHPLKAASTHHFQLAAEFIPAF
jgi:hypothetical protein